MSCATLYVCVCAEMPCFSSPCRNGANCSEQYSPVVNYTCDCTANYTGRDCQLCTLSLSLPPSVLLSLAHAYKVKKVNVVDLSSASTQSVSKALRYSTRCQGINSFTCTSCVSSASGMSHTCLCLPSRSWYLFTDPGGMEG